MHQRILERRRSFIPVGTFSEFSSLTDRDKTLLLALREARFEWIALSFVNSSADIENLRRWISTELDWTPKIIAKIESRLGLHNLDEIARKADGIMVARGDLALQVGFKNLWHAQNLILRSAQREGKYSVVATGFLETLARTGLPSRAEIVDVFTALHMGADAIMLSDETTVGNFPVETVDFLATVEATWGEAHQATTSIVLA